MAEEKKIKSYKGFDKDLKCRGFQYEIGKEYTHEGEVKLCYSGFHACEQPIDVFGYYPPGTSRYCEVEQSGKISKGDDSKVASSKIKIGAEIGIHEIVKAQIEYVKAHTTTKYTDPKMATAGEYGVATAGEYGAATAGTCGAATAGIRGVATAGEYGAATAGTCGAATAGIRGVATAGEYGVATAGEYGAATAGYRGVATAGYRGVATAGTCGAATSKGCSAVGENGVAVARGAEVKVKGGLGSVLVLCKENGYNYNIKEWIAVVVDGKNIKPDTWYKLENGKVIEAKEEETK